MSAEKRMTEVWVSLETYRRLLAVRGAMHRADGKIRNMDEVIAELIEFWKKQAEAQKTPMLCKLRIIPNKTKMESPQLTVFYMFSLAPHFRQCACLSELSESCPLILTLSLRKK